MSGIVRWIISVEEFICWPRYNRAVGLNGCNDGRIMGILEPMDIYDLEGVYMLGNAPPSLDPISSLNISSLHLAIGKANLFLTANIQPRSVGSTKCR